MANDITAVREQFLEKLPAALQAVADVQGETDTLKMARALPKGYLYRFLEARQLNPDKACDMFSNYVKWCHDINMERLYNPLSTCPTLVLPRNKDGIAARAIGGGAGPFLPPTPAIAGYKPGHLITTDRTWCEIAQSSKRHYPHAHHGVDKKGRPIYVERLGQVKIDAILKETSEDILLSYFIRECEVLNRVIFPAASLSANKIIDKSLTILDLSGLGLGHVMNSKIRKLIQQLIALQQDNYPESLGDLVIVNTPPIFATMWTLVKGLLNQQTQDKITIIKRSDDPLPHLLKMADKNQLPLFLGGTCSCGKDCLMVSMGPWMRSDIREILARVPFYEIMRRIDDGQNVYEQETNSDKNENEISST